MKTPTTYSEWAILLDQFGDGNDLVLEELSNGTFTVDAGTATRFYTRVEEVYKKRKQNWLDKFQRSFELQNFKNEDDFDIALRNGKQNLSPISRFIQLKGLPDDLRNTLKKDLEDFINEIKVSLKKNASKMPSGREKILFLLDSFELNAVYKQTETQNNFQNTTQTTLPTGRKIIF